MAYWAYKWTHSPARVHMKVYREVYTQKRKHGIKKAYKWILQTVTYIKHRLESLCKQFVHMYKSYLLHKTQTINETKNNTHNSMQLIQLIYDQGKGSIKI